METYLGKKPLTMFNNIHGKALGGIYLSLIYSNFLNND